MYYRVLSCTILHYLYYDVVSVLSYIIVYYHAFYGMTYCVLPCIVMYETHYHIILSSRSVSLQSKENVAGNDEFLDLQLTEKENTWRI